MCRLIRSRPRLGFCSTGRETGVRCRSRQSQVSRALQVDASRIWLMKPCLFPVLMDTNGLRFESNMTVVRSLRCLPAPSSPLLAATDPRH